jgi:serine/threonine protein kinase
METQPVISHNLSPEDEEPTFEILRKAENNVWIVTRQGDPRKEQYLASPSPFGVGPGGTIDTAQNRQEAGALKSLVSNHNQAHTIRQILNHENLLSIAGVMQYQVFTKRQTPDAQENNTQLLVWDFADAGNLSTVFRHYPVEDSSFYLPESLCWHVLRSMIRAVTWLHEGKRLVYQHQNGGPEDSLRTEWLTVNTDWFSILHRAIEPKNIWFQHPRGTETYGQCKLGDFSTAAVTCHAVDGRNDSKKNDSPQGSHGIALATREGLQPLEVTREALDGEMNLAEMDEVTILRSEATYQPTNICFREIARIHLETRFGR